MSRTSGHRLELGFCAAALACLAFAWSPVAAAVPAFLNYQGHVGDSGGPMNGTFPMTFELFATPTGGSPLWSESYPGVVVTAGVFNILLGTSTPLPLGSIFTGQTLWIETTINGNLLTPRRPIVSVAYAARAALADSAIAAPAAVPAGSVVYTRWGRTSCPAGASLVYQGRAAGSYYNQSGSGANTLCLTQIPTWDSFSDVNQNGALVYGLEYQSTGAGPIPPALHNFEAPCAVCLRENARVSLMIPGTQICPAGWTVEYAGHLMSNHYINTGSREFVCVDRAAEAVGTNANNLGNLWYSTEGECGSLPCPPYVHDRELTCVICTRP